MVDQSNMSGKEMPLIGVYIDDVQQEFMPRPPSARGWNDYYWDDQWTSDWRRDGTSPWHKQWNQDHGYNARSPIRNITSIASLVLRDEPFGGLAYDPVLRTVFALNEVGYKLLRYIQSPDNRELPSGDRKELRSSTLKIIAFLSSYGVAPTDGEINRASEI